MRRDGLSLCFLADAASNNRHKKGKRRMRAREIIVVCWIDQVNLRERIV
jgi:hypothetical protein